MILVDLTPDVSGHLAMALRQHMKWARATGLLLPEGVARLERAFTNQAIQGQRRTALDSPAPSIHDQHEEPLLVTYGTAANKLSCSTRTIGRLVAAGKLTPVKVGGLSRIPMAQLEGIATEDAA